jgi:hypothetical protein
MSFNCFSVLSLEIPASSAVEFFRIECVEEASQLTPHFSQPESSSGIPFMGVIIPWVLVGFCLCIFSSAMSFFHMLFI